MIIITPQATKASWERSRNPAQADHRVRHSQYVETPIHLSNYPFICPSTRPSVHPPNYVSLSLSLYIYI